MISAKDLIKVYSICSRLHNSVHVSLDDKVETSVDIGEFVLSMDSKTWTLKLGKYKSLLYGSRIFKKANCMFNASPFTKVTSINFSDMAGKTIELDIPPELALVDSGSFSQDEFEKVLDAAELFEFFINTHADNGQNAVLTAFLELNFQHVKCIQGHAFPFAVESDIDYSVILEQEDLIYES